MGADPVNLVTGQQEETFKGLSMGVVGGTLSFDLIYNGAATHYTDPLTTANYNGSGLGSNWAHTFDYQIYKLADTIWNVHYPDMHETQFITLYNNGNFRTNSFPLTRGVQDSVKRDPVTREFTMILKNRTLLQFDSSGYLLNIKDRNNNTVQVQRNAQHEITAIVGEGGRTFRFTTVNGKITQISAPGNHNLTFTHVGDDLTSFTKPENRTTQIQYIAGTHQIERITKPMGNNLVRNEYTNGKISKQYDGKSYPTDLQYNFPSTGWVTVTYADGGTRIYKHDETWRVIREWDEEGKSDSTAYGPNNLPLHHLDNKGYPTSFTSDSRTNITDISMPQGRKTHKVFNGTNDIIISVDAKNDTTRYIRDSRGNPIKTLFSDGTFTLSHFDNHGQNTANIDARGIRIDSMTYTPQGDLDKRFTVTNSYQYAHDSLGRQIAVTDLGMNRTDSTIYNKAGEIIRHRRADGLVEKMAYNANGLLTQHTNFKGISFTKAYDLNDQLTDTYGPRDFHEKTRYNNRNVKVAFINAKGDSITSVVDRRGFTLQTRLNNNPPATNTLDDAGNVIAVTDPMGVTITSTLDSLYQNTQTNFGGLTTTKTDYDIAGFPIRTYNGLNDFKRYAYTKRSVLDSLYDELNNPIVLTRNANLSVTNIKDAEQHNNTTIYDRAGRDSCSIDGSGMQTRVLRNPDGTVQQTIRPDNSTISQTYTANGQTATTAYSGGPTYTNTYDPNGNTATITGPLGTDVFGRDSLDIITSYKDVWNNTMLFEKNIIGETKKLTYPNGYQVRTVTNKYGKPDSVILAPNKAIIYAYDPAGHLLTKNAPNGVRLTIQRDVIYRPTGLLYTKQNGAVTDTLFYQWCHRTPTGDIDSFTVKGSAVLKPTAKSVTKTNTFQPNDAPTSSGTSNFTNNPNGAVTNQTTASGTLQVHSSFVENDLLDTLKSPSLTLKMAWNGLEKPVSITRNGVQTRLVQDCTAPVAKLLQTQNAQGTTTGTYIHDYIGPAAYIDSAGSFNYYAFDLFGNTVFLTNDNGQVVDKYAYNLYCTQVKHIGGSKQLFCGMGQHGALTINDSTLNIQSRFLQTPRNCFMTKDRAPFDNKDPMTLHKYIAFNNNPVAYYDLNGWCATESTFDRVVGNFNNTLSIVKGITTDIIDQFSDLSNSEIRKVTQTKIFNRYIFDAKGRHLVKEILKEGELIPGLNRLVNTASTTVKVGARKIPGLDIALTVVNAGREIANRSWDTHTVVNTGIDVILITAGVIAVGNPVGLAAVGVLSIANGIHSIVKGDSRNNWIDNTFGHINYSRIGK